MKTVFKIDNLEFIDFPHETPLGEYDKSEREFLDYFECHPAVAAIYKIGSVNDPGISDLDLILVLKENEILERKDYEFLARTDGYIFAHSPFVIPESLLPYVHYFFYPSGLHNLTGESSPLIRPVSSTDRSQLAWLICAEAALSRLGDIIFQTTCKSNLSMRIMLLKLNSIKHNISLLRNVNKTLVISEQDEFISQITELRKAWFSLQKETQIRKTLIALHNGIAVLSKLVDELALLSKDIFNLSSENEIVGHSLFPNSLQVLKFEPEARTNFKTIANPLCFLRNFSQKHKARIVRHVNDISIITVPYEMVYLFSPINPEASDTVKTMKRNVIIRGKDRPLWWSQENESNLILERFQLVDKYNHFIERGNLSRMSVLLMAPWLTNNKAKFYEIKRTILASMLKLLPI